MKKTILLTLVALFVCSSMSMAAIKYSFGGSFSTSSYTTQPLLVVNFDDKYDLVAGYQTIAEGSGNDSQTNMVLGGTMWTMKNGPITCGWSGYYVSFATPTGGKASDDTVSGLNLGFTAKTDLVPSVSLRGDAILLSTVSGKAGGADTGGTSIAPHLQLSIVFNFI
jgi:hypothetical protein